MLIESDNFSYDIPDKFMEKKIIPKEYKELFKWVLSWYIDNHLKFASLDSLNDKIMEKYINKSEKMITIVYHNLGLECINGYNNLDIEIYNKIPKNKKSECLEEN